MADYPRICKQCLTLVPAKPLKKPRDMSDEEFNYQKIIDESRHCTQCNGNLTRHIKKVIDRVEQAPNREEILKLFGVDNPKVIAVLKSKQAEESKLQAEIKAIDLELIINRGDPERILRLRNERNRLVAELTPATRGAGV